MELSGQVQIPAVLPMGTEQYLFSNGLMGPTASLDAVKEIKVSEPCCESGTNASVVQDKFKLFCSLLFFSARHVTIISVLTSYSPMYSLFLSVLKAILFFVLMLQFCILLDYSVKYCV
jgi:hypothetical protein